MSDARTVPDFTINTAEEGLQVDVAVEAHTYVQQDVWPESSRNEKLLPCILQRKIYAEEHSSQACKKTSYR